MASSRKTAASETVVARIDAALAAHVPAGARLTLGLSGGIDAGVLLAALAALRPRRGFHLDCLHVHHGISPNADAWAAHARALAAAYGLDCAVRKVDLAPHRGLGLEGAARAARYAVYAGCDCDFVVLAHQQDDQAETVLLQLARGAGVEGLAAMPVCRPLRAGQRRPRLLRPMLDVSRAEVEAYARSRGLRWVEDESNADTGLARNLVRHEVMPLLERINPAARVNIARAAAHLGDAAALLDALADADLERAQAGEALDLGVLRGLGGARAANALRRWLARAGIISPSTAELREALRQLFEAREDAGPLADFGTAALRRYRGRAFLVPHLPEPPQGYQARWNGELAWPLPELGGVLHFEPAAEGGLAERHLSSMTVRLRAGGERFRTDARRPHRTLKHLLQEAAVPPWQRERLPLLYVGERLACVPGIGVAPEFQATPGERGVLPRWRLARE